MKRMNYFEYSNVTFKLETHFRASKVVFFTGSTETLLSISNSFHNSKFRNFRIVRFESKI